MGANVFNVLLVLLLVVMGSVGYRSRLFTTTTIFLRLAAGFIVGYAFAGPFGWALAKIAPSLGMSFWEFIAFALLFAAVFLTLTHATMVRLETDDMVIPFLLDKIGGVAGGVASGALMGGILLIAWSMAVSFSPIRFVTDEARIKLDMGKIVLTEFGRLHEKMPGAREFHAAEAVAAYRNADVAATQKAKDAAPKKEEGPNAKKGKGASGEEDVSAGGLRKKLQQE